MSTKALFTWGFTPDTDWTIEVTFSAGTSPNFTTAPISTSMTYNGLYGTQASDLIVKVLAALNTADAATWSLVADVASPAKYEIRRNHNTADSADRIATLEIRAGLALALGIEKAAVADFVTLTSGVDTEVEDNVTVDAIITQFHLQPNYQPRYAWYSHQFTILADPELMTDVDVIDSADGSYSLDNYGSFEEIEVLYETIRAAAVKTKWANTTDHVAHFPGMVVGDPNCAFQNFWAAMSDPTVLPCRFYEDATNADFIEIGVADGEWLKKFGNAAKRKRRNPLDYDLFIPVRVWVS